MGKSVGSLGPGLCSSLFLVCDLANYLTSLSFHFHSSKMQVLLALTHVTGLLAGGEQIMHLGS